MVVHAGSLLFSATLKDAAGLKAVLDLVDKDFSQDAVSMQISGNGLQIHIIDDAQTSFLDAFFPAAKSAFSQFNCHVEHLKIWIKPSFLSNALRSACGGKPGNTAGARVQMAIYEPADKLLLTVEPLFSTSTVSSRIKHTITLLDPARDEDSTTIVDAADFTFTVEAFSEQPGLFVEVAAQLKSADCEEVEVLLDSKHFSFRTTQSKSGMIDTEVTVYPEAGGGRLCLYAEGDAEIRARYAFRHFQRIGRLCKAGCRVLFQMADDAPFSIVCDLLHGGACQLFLAPLID
ncbi:hypothetical protein ABBQ38_002702 [Trebouxia sp. C0009 RCD-2024]